MFSELIIASHNQGKVSEIRELLAPLGIAISSASEHDLPEPEETESTFEGNAALKAEAAAGATNMACLADDSGLAVDALDGAPGIYSARWAGPEKDFAIAMQRIKDELEAKGETAEGARAHFICNLALARPNVPTEHFEGRVSGRLSFPPRGDKGFGYDPIFVPDGYETTFAEIEHAEKQRISHRALAFAALYDWLKNQSSAA